MKYLNSTGWFVLIVISLSVVLVGCGTVTSYESKEIEANLEENMSESEHTMSNYDESNEEIADDKENMDEDNSFSDKLLSNDAAAIVEEEVPPINPCFDYLLDHDMQIMDSDCLFMSEEELVQKYGMPSRKKGTDIYWDFEEDGIKYSVTMMIGDEFNDYQEGYKMMEHKDSRFPTSFCEIKENIESSDFATVSMWFDDVKFNHAYEYSTLNTYDDFRNKIGDSGRMVFLSPPNIYVMWYFEEIDKGMRIAFDAKTGMISDYSKDEPDIIELYEYSLYMDGWYDR